jgi:tetratricopeptide (TPR) repeat protein
VDYVDYLPHLYLAAACHLASDLTAARAHLAQAEKEGLAAKSDAGKPLLDAYRVLLGAQPPGSAPEPNLGRPRYTEFERKPPVLSEAQAAELRAEVLARCQLRPDTKPTEAPWYFHYQLGRSLLDKGDSQRALDAFLEAATRRNDPARGARMYGMWFTTYLPYYAIAQAHARLGNWDCAKSAIEMSERTHEVNARDAEYKEFRSLVLETDKNIAPTAR